MSEFFEAKAGAGELTSADFGQLADYHARVPGRVRGMLFNATRMWLYESHDGHPVRLVKAQLGERGSRDLLRAFFDAPRPEPPLVSLLRRLCRDLRVVPAAAALGAGAFLGAGASGRVFRVQRVGADTSAPALALKVACGRGAAEALTVEFERLRTAAARGAAVVRVVADSLHIVIGDDGSGLGGGYLMDEVLGAPAPAPSGVRCAAAFAALASLHAAGVAHGDARLPNLLERGDGASGLVWIDLRALDVITAVSLELQQRGDARSLARSVLGLMVDEPLPSAVADALKAIPRGGADAYRRAVADAAFAAAGEDSR